MAPSRKFSIALLLYTTILWISQVTYDVTANKVTDVQDTVLGTQELPNSSTTSDIDQPEDTVEDTASSTEGSLGYYQRYKQFVAKHNKTFTIVFGVLFVISLAVAIWAICAHGKDQKGYIAFLILFGIGIFGFVLCKLFGRSAKASFGSSKESVVGSTVDATR